jgi:hypothetical protein
VFQRCWFCFVYFLGRENVSSREYFVGGQIDNYTIEDIVGKGIYALVIC